MHHTCVTPSKPGGDLLCPICKTEFKLDEESSKEMPYWHEAEFGTVLGKKKIRQLHPEVGKAPFPDNRWPTVEEAKLHGYKSVKDWYIDYRSTHDGRQQLDLKRFEVEFTGLESRRKPKKPDEEGEEDDEDLPDPQDDKWEACNKTSQSEPARVEGKEVAIGKQIRAVKERLLKKGLVGKQIQDHVEMISLVYRLDCLKKLMPKTAAEVCLSLPVPY
jgi:hypothetical protein